MTSMAKKIYLHNKYGGQGVGYNYSMDHGKYTTAFGEHVQFYWKERPVSPVASSPVKQSSISAPQPVSIRTSLVQFPETWGNIIPVTGGGVRRILGQYIWMALSADGTKLSAAISVGKPADKIGSRSLTKVWANGAVIYDASTGTTAPGMTVPTFYQGTEDQLPDARIVAAYGANRTPGYRDLMYFVFENLDIGTYFGGSPPTFEGEVTDGGGSTTWTTGNVLKMVGLMGGYDPATEMELFGNFDDVTSWPYFSEQTTTKDTWLAMSRILDFSLIDGGPKIQFRRDVLGEYFTATADDLVLPPSQSAMTMHRVDQMEVPSELDLQYIDITQPWRFSTQRARRVLSPLKATAGNRITTIKFQAVMPASSALSLAAYALYKEAIGRIQLNFMLTWRALEVQPGDTVQVPMNNDLETVRVVRADIQPNLCVQIQGVRLGEYANIVATADAGTIGAPPSIAIESSIAPRTGSVVVTGNTPTILADASLMPATGSVVVTGNPPTISNLLPLAPSTGSVVVTGSVSDIGISTPVAPSTGSVIVTGNPPTLTTALLVAPSTGSVTVTGFVSSANVGFTFTDLTGLAVLYDMNDIGLSDGDSIGPTAILDSSGNSRNTTGRFTSSTDAIYKTNILNGYAVLRNASASGQTAYTMPNFMSGFTEGTIFFVCKATADASTKPPPTSFMGNGGSPAQHFTFSDNIYYCADGTTSRKTLGAPGAGIVNAWNIVVLRMQSGYYNARVNGTQLFTTATNTVAFPTAPLLLGSNSVSTFAGDVAIVGMYSVKQSDADAQKIEGKLAWKYGITSILPIGHTYKSVAP